MNEISVANSESLSEKIARKFINDVRDGVLKPGDKLPSEKQLIENFKVSKSTIREALRVLKILNIIDIQQGKGSYITAMNASLLMDQFDLTYLIENSTVEYLFEARLAIEPEIAAIAASRITDEEIDELYELLEQDKHDLLFHQKIAEISKNPVLICFVSSITSLGEISRSRTSIIAGVKEKAYEQNLQLADALRARDPEKARKVMKEHIHFVESSYQEKKI